MAARQFISVNALKLLRINQIEKALIKKGAITKDEIDAEKPDKPKKD